MICRLGAEPAGVTKIDMHEICAVELALRSAGPKVGTISATSADQPIPANFRIALTLAL